MVIYNIYIYDLPKTCISKDCLKIISKNCLKIRNSQIPPWQKDLICGKPIESWWVPIFHCMSFSLQSLEIQLLDELSLSLGSSPDWLRSGNSNCPNGYDTFDRFRLGKKTIFCWVKSPRTIDPRWNWTPWTHSRGWWVSCPMELEYLPTFFPGKLCKMIPHVGEVFPS